MKGSPKIVLSVLLLLWPMLATSAQEHTSAQELTIESGMAEILRLKEPVSHIFLVDHTVADVQLQTPQTLYIYGQKPGQTTLFATTKKGDQVLNMRLTVANNVSTLREVVRSIAPDSDVTVTSAGGTLILKGTVASPKIAADLQSAASRFVSDAKSIVNQLTVQTPVQVNLRVKIAEISRTVTRDLGINWENITKPGALVVGLASSGSFVDLTSKSQDIGFTSGSSGGSSSSSSSSSGSTGTTGTTSSSKLFQLSSSGNPNILMSYQNGDKANLNVMIDAVAAEGLAVILSEPNLTSLSGQAAHFTAGGEIPITIPGTANNPATVQYKEYGVKLAFTPTVLSENLIQIQVAPEVSELTSAGSTSLGPALSKRTASTVVQLNSGQSFAIAGLIQNVGNSTISAVPGLGDLPGFLGALFRSTKFSRRETELVMIVTPYIVKPSNTPLKTPLDQVKEASHLDRILMGKIAKTGKNVVSSPQGSSPNPPRLVGQAGFLIE